MTTPRHPPLTVIGIDAATDAKKTGLARGRIDAGKLVVEAVELGSEASPVAKVVASWIRGPTLIAIDAPLGWPLPMGPALASHRAGQAIDLEGSQMFARLTDRRVRETVKKKPLDVGADRIAHTAVAALRLLQDVRDATGLAIPLSWTPRDSDVTAVEVYPAATLLGRGLSPKGYKKSRTKNDDACRVARQHLARALAGEVELPDLDTVVATDHALDAVLCLVAALDYVRGEVLQPPTTGTERIRREGWIWFRVPDSSGQPIKPPRTIAE